VNNHTAEYKKTQTVRIRLERIDRIDSQRYRAIAQFGFGIGERELVITATSADLESFESFAGIVADRHGLTITHFSSENPVYECRRAQWKWAVEAKKRGKSL
jgi:hypothetical protein